MWYGMAWYAVGFTAILSLCVFVCVEVFNSEAWLLDGRLERDEWMSEWKKEWLVEWSNVEQAEKERTSGEKLCLL